LQAGSEIHQREEEIFGHPGEGGFGYGQGRPGGKALTPRPPQRRWRIGRSRRARSSSRSKKMCCINIS
jgi:hypothetical protein